MRMSLVALAAVAAAATPTAAFADTTVVNSTPADTWYFGAGNGSTNDTEVLTTDRGDQLYLRWKAYQNTPPQSDADGKYSFALGTVLSFDWGFDTTGTSGTLQRGVNPFTLVTPLLTVTNLGTGGTFSYNPLIDPSDSYQSGSVQNSARLTFGFLSGVGFNPNVDGLYSVRLDVAGLAGGAKTLTALAQVGAGATPAVPEPATWGLMIAGFGLVGASMRRRSTAVRFA